MNERLRNWYVDTVLRRRCSEMGQAQERSESAVHLFALELAGIKTLLADAPDREPS